jgi:RNA polymerase sigma-70 factor (ECF subfamily)
MTNSDTGMNQNFASDDELMQAVLKRDDSALALIYSRYEALLKSAILSVLHDESEVEDVLHDVMLQIWDQAGRYVASERGLRGFLVTLARRRALDRLRRKVAYRKATDNLLGEVDNPLTQERSWNHSEVYTKDLSDLLQSMIRQLPAAQQEVITLTFFQGMSQREIASRRSISLGTVKTRLHLAQKKLRHSLRPLQHKI